MSGQSAEKGDAMNENAARTNGRAVTDFDGAESARGILNDAFERIAERVGTVLEGTEERIRSYRPDPRANSLAWLVWHLTRVQDEHLAELAANEPLWLGEGWVDRFDLDLEPSATGYGASPEQVATLDDIGADELSGYHAAVATATASYLESLSSQQLESVVSEDGDQSVTVAVRLVSVVGDCLSHVGQAEYVRGLAERDLG